MRCRLPIERGDANLKGDFALGQKQAIVGGSAGHGLAGNFAGRCRLEKVRCGKVRQVGH